MNSELNVASPQAESSTANPTPLAQVSMQRLQFPAGPAVRVVGVGNAALTVMELLMDSGIPASSCTVVNTDQQSLDKSRAAQKILLEPKDAQTLPTGADPVRGAAAAEARKQDILDACNGAKVVILVAGLGGAAGTGAAPVIAQIVRTAGARVMAFAIMPFACECLRLTIANAGLGDLREAANLAVVFANQRVIATATESTRVLDTYRSANELLVISIRAAYFAFTGGAVMGLPFTDICSLVRDRSDECALIAASSTGQDRVNDICDRLLNHPSLQGASILPGANVVSIYVLGGANLAMLDVNRIVERLGRECGSAPLLMGAAIDPDLEGTLLVAVLVGCAEDSPSEGRRDEAPACARTSSPIGDINESVNRRPPSRLLPPPPELSPERALEIREIQAGRKPKKSSPRMRQTQLPLDIISKGRFDKAEPTIHKGEDLDVPTYVRRGIALN